MALITRNELDNFVELREAISDMLMQGIDVPLNEIDWSNIANARNQVIKLLTAYSRVGARMASKQSAAFYDMVRERSIGAKMGASTIDTVNPKAIEGFVRAGISDVVKRGTPVKFKNEVRNRVAYEVNRASGNTIVYNANQDKEYVRWARVPSAGDACMFCIMLAGRGAIYKSYESAGGAEHYHENCRCSIVPMFGAKLKRTKRGGWVARTDKTQIEGYDPEDYFKVYDDAVESGEITTDEWNKLKDYY